MGKYTKESPIFFENIREINGIKERRCSKCNEWKPETIEYFYMHNKSKPEKGFQAECKVCAIKRSREIALKNPNRSKRKVEQWQEENKIRMQQVRKQYNDRNKNKIYDYTSNYYQQHPEKMKIYNKRHRKHDVSNTEWKVCKEYFDNKCAYCGLHISEHIQYRKGKAIYMDLHKEHVDDNGANDLSNCVPGCQNCNSTKSKKTIDEFLESKLIEKFTKEKYNKIIQWISEDYKKHIEPKPPYIITRKQNEDKRTYHYQLWTADEKRNMVKCIATADKKQGLKEYINKFFPKVS